MSKSKHATPTAPPAEIDWAGIRVQRVAYEGGTKIFTQGDPAISVMYVAHGPVRLSVLSHAGKEAVIAVLHDNHFFGEGCLVGQPHRMATASAMAACTIVIVEKV
jgi:CRP-like cAMP-binding protein